MAMTNVSGAAQMVQTECTQGHELRVLVDGTAHACHVDTACMIVLCEACSQKMQELVDGRFRCETPGCNGWTTTFSIT